MRQIYPSAEFCHKEHKYHNYCISVQTYILMQVETSVRGNRQQLLQQMEAVIVLHLSPPPCLSLLFALSPTLAASHVVISCRMFVYVLVRACFLSVHAGNICVMQSERAYFASETESQVVMRVCFYDFSSHGAKRSIQS